MKSPESQCQLLSLRSILGYIDIPQMKSSLIFHVILPYLLIIFPLPETSIIILRMNNTIQSKYLLFLKSLYRRFCFIFFNLSFPAFITTTFLFYKDVFLHGKQSLYFEV